MKKTILLLMLAAIGFSAAASPVDAESAAAVARSFIAQRVANAGHVTATVVYTHMKPQSSSPAMYAVNVTYGNNGKGFVIVSADDVAYPVLGYSVAAYWPTTGAKGTGAAVPLCSQITEYLNGISSQIEQASSSSYRHPSSSVAEWQQLLSTNVTPLTTPPDSVGPLLVTQWSQSPYYNEYCPEDANNPGSKAVTGCVATAMAQIIRYWQHPVHGRGTHTYEDNGSGNFGVQSADFANATYDYANMPFTLNASSTSAQVNAVAHLIYHCGVACDMTYGIYGSSSYDIVARVGLINYFHYSPDISYVEKSNVSATQWDSILHHHLAAGEPLMFCGDDPNAGGHAFVCDGYKSDGYYHFNFGWDGYGDGWYRTDAVNPSYQFNSGQSVLAGIVPDNNGNVILANRLGTSTFTVGNQPLEFYNTRGHDVYRANCYTNDCSNNVLFTSSDATKQLNIEMIDADCQNLNVYDGEGGTLLTGISSVITASGCNVTTLGPSQVSSTGNELYLVHQGDFRCVGYKVRISQSSASATAYIISATSNNASMGSVTGGGTYDAGATVTLTATSNCGCRFVRWTSNGTQVSTENPYSFAASQNISLTAEFETDVVLTCSSGQSLKYVLDCNNNTATIVGHNGCNGALVLPSEIVYNNQNYVVNRVADTAFYNSGITSLVIPEPINYIGSLAFGACENLQQVTFNAVNCTLAGSTAEVSPFGDNSHITTVVIGPGVTTIPAWLFGHHSGITGNLVIPEGVTRIEKDAFSYAEITSVTLPQSLQYIGWGAFYGCYNLTSVTFPNAVDTIMNYSFAYDYALRKVSFGSSVAFIGAYAFSSCGNMDTIWSYNPVPPSAANALYGVAGDAVIVVPCGSVPAYQTAGEWSNFTNIREVAGCAFTVTAVANDASMGTVTGGGEYADGTTVTLTATPVWGCRFVRWKNAAGDTVSLDATFSITVTQDTALTAEFSDRIPIVAPSGQTLYYRIYNTYAELVPPGAPGPGVIYNHNYIEGDLVIPESIIYDGVELNVTAIRKVTNGWGSSTGCFEGCRTLTSVVIPNTVTYMDAWAFNDCTNLTSVVLSNSLSSIAACAFMSCLSLRNITIPSSVHAIYDRAFYYSGLRSIIIPSSVNYFDDLTFKYCYSLDSVFIFNEIPPSISSNTFTVGSSNRKYYVPCGTTSAYQNSWGTDYVFSEDWEPYTVETLVNDVSMGSATSSICVYMATLTATPNTGYHFVQWSDGNTDNPRTLVVTQDTLLTAEFAISQYTITAVASNPNYGTVIGGGAYSNGETATLTATANCGYQFSHWTDSYGNVVSSDATYTFTVTGNGSFTAVFEAVAVTEFDAVATSGQTLHFTVNSDGTSVTITGHEANISGNLVIPATVNYCENNYYVTRIAADAFSSSSGLTSVTIPSTITYIGEYAFWYLVLDVYYLGTLSQWCDIDFNGYTFGGFNLYINNTLVTDVVIPEGIIQIKNSTFDRCISLTSITIPSSVTSIGAAAFISCTGVTSVILPESLTTIGSQAFENCSGLTEITCLAATVPSLEDRAFTSVNATIPVYVPCGSVANYQAATGWSNFTNIQCISQSVTTDTMEIRTCTGHTLRFEVSNVTHTATVIGYVGQCAGTLVVPAWFSVDGVRYTVTAVGPRAFENCRGLESVTLPVTITLVDDEAFKGCSGLISVDIK